jgi:hypothetical protein
MLLREEITIVKALMAAGYWPSAIRFDSSGRFDISGALYHAENPDYSRLLKSKEDQLAALEASSQEQAKEPDEGEKDTDQEELIDLIKELGKLGYSVEGFSKKDEYPWEKITLELARCSS